MIFYTIAHISPEDNIRILETCNNTGVFTVMLSDMLHTLQNHLTRQLPGFTKRFPFPVDPEADARVAATIWKGET